MRPKTATIDKRNTPAPTAYHPKVDFSKHIIINNVRFGRDTRKPLNIDPKTPGPGNYEVEYKEKPGPKYHMGLKTDPDNKNFNPGPGTYENKTEIEYNVDKHKGTSMVPKRPQSAANTNPPGPGAYEQDPKPIKHRAPNFSIGKQTRDPADKEKLGKPGPGQYESNPKLKGTNEPKYGFGTGQRDETRTSAKENPGPGNYNYIEPIGKHAPKYIMGLKTNPLEGNLKVPGPGAYDPSIEKYSKKRTAPKIGMGTSIRDGFYRSAETPGPGNYFAPIESGREAPKIRFGTERRMEDMKLSQGPTATTYDIKSEFESNLKHGKGMSMTQRRPLSASTMANPGPGAYDALHNFTKNKHPNTR